MTTRISRGPARRKVRLWRRLTDLWCRVRHFDLWSAGADRRGEIITIGRALWVRCGRCGRGHQIRVRIAADPPPGKTPI